MKVLVAVALVQIFSVAVCQNGAIDDLEDVFHRPYDTYNDYEESQMTKKDFYRFLMRNYYLGDTKLPWTKNMRRTVPKFEQDRSGTGKQYNRQSYNDWCDKPSETPIVEGESHRGCVMDTQLKSTSAIIKGAIIDDSEDEYEYCPREMLVVRSCCEKISDTGVLYRRVNGDTLQDYMHPVKRLVQRDISNTTCSGVVKCNLGLKQVKVRQRTKSSHSAHNQEKDIPLNVPSSCECS